MPPATSRSTGILLFNRIGRGDGRRNPTRPCCRATWTPLMPERHWPTCVPWGSGTPSGSYSCLASFSSLPSVRSSSLLPVSDGGRLNVTKEGRILRRWHRRICHVDSQRQSRRLKEGGVLAVMILSGLFSIVAASWMDRESPPLRIGTVCKSKVRQPT